MKKALAILAAVALPMTGYGGFPYPTNTGTFASSEADGDFDQFTWKWVNDNDQQINVNFDETITGYGIYFRMSDGPSEADTAYLTLTTNSMTIADGTNLTFAVVSTNIPPPAVYWCEFQMYSGTVYKTLAQGKISTKWSVLDNTNAFALGALPEYILDTTFTQDGGFLVGTGSGTYQEETGTTARASMGAAYTGDMANVQSATNALDTRVTALEGSTSSIPALVTATNAMTVRIAANETATNVLNTAVVNLNAATNTLDSDVTSLNDATNANLLAIVALQSATGVLDTAITTAEADIVKLETSTNALATRMSTAETDITALEGATNANLVAITALNTATTALDTAVTSIEGATNALATRVGTAETDIEALESATNANATAIAGLTLDDVCENGNSTDKDIELSAAHVGAQEDSAAVRLRYGSDDAWHTNTIRARARGTYNGGDVVVAIGTNNGGDLADVLVIDGITPGVYAAVSNWMSLGTATMPWSALHVAGGYCTDAERGALEDSTNALDTRLGTAETDIGNLESSTNFLTTEVGKNDTDISHLNSSTVALHTAVGNLEDATNAINTRMGTAETDIEALESATNANATAIAGLTLDDVAGVGAETDVPLTVSNTVIDETTLTLWAPDDVAALDIANDAGTLVASLWVTADGNGAVDITTTNGYKVFAIDGDTETTYCGGDFMPRYSNAFHLGSADRPWAELYVGEGSLHVTNQSINVARITNWDAGTNDVPLAGGTMSGDLNMGGNEVTNATLDAADLTKGTLPNARLDAELQELAVLDGGGKDYTNFGSVALGASNIVMSVGTHSSGSNGWYVIDPPGTTNWILW